MGGVGFGFLVTGMIQWGQKSNSKTSLELPIFSFVEFVLSFSFADSLPMLYFYVLIATASV